jgi:hypothetical protein
MARTELDKIRWRLEHASPGPWIEGDSYEQSSPGFYVCDARGRIVCASQDGTDCPLRSEDAHFIAHAPGDIKYLLDMIEQLVPKTG